MSFLDSFISASLPFVPKAIVGLIASRYIAGETLEDAIRTVKELNAAGFKTTIDVLGEFVDTREEALKHIEYYHEVLEAIEREKLDSGVSVKPTAIGLSVDRDFALDNITSILENASRRNVFMRIDMEDSPYTENTIWLYRQLRNGKKLGVVVQSYLRRTEQDVRDLIKAGESNFRLCKGIYVEPEKIAFKGREEVRQNFLKVLRIMLETKTYVGIATHDEYLVDESEKLIKELNVPPTAYEFQMLLGVRPDLRNQIKARGHKMRIYVPFGKSWYGYSTRRLKENPAIAGYVFKSLFRKL
ncbi:proline dehydrogenase family protein [bacterium]|nr:proline dehydrogenase family protein [bacterium]MBU1637226.1 proline dehydrogenase family protein [bacterium]